MLRVYCLYSGFCTAHTTSTRSIWAFGTAHHTFSTRGTRSTRSILRPCTLVLSALGVHNVFDAPSVHSVGSSIQPQNCTSYIQRSMFTPFPGDVPRNLVLGVFYDPLRTR